MANLISVVTDKLSGATLFLSPQHVETVKFDRLGENSSSAYAVRMSSGAIIRLDKVQGAKVLAALGVSPPQPQKGDDGG